MAARKEQSEPPAKASVNMEELRELIALLRENGLAELELEREDFRVRLRREGVAPSGDHSQHMVAPPSAPVSLPDMAPATAAPSTAAQAPTNSGAQGASATSTDQDLHIIQSPIVGTFYRSPSPTAEPFVKIGSNVEAASVVCIIEAMKLMNEIQAEASGEVVKIYVENGQPVEYGQPLFGIRS
ncbi:MAG: acetyl-CoA carboxylase biotin carboxyl carrier protein [Acidobacteria bacterium]|nr:acetyl-CoA carboxylase biotin carboxyl carrier protein [Acidobacteriota bacterium]